MKITHTLFTTLIVSAIALSFTTARALEDHKEPVDATEVAETTASRAEIDAMGSESIQELTRTDDNARALYGQAKGYAVFRATKAGLVVTGAGGSGVAVNKGTGERTYMRMGTAGVGVGAGVQNFRLIALFETDAALKKFVDGGWDAATSAQAAAGKSGVNVASSFVDNVAIFQLTNKGLMAQADLTGTRFWKSEKLNF
jgi:lipid-binding SYLF domain-containing protein